LDKKVAIVTGGAKGLGFGIAEYLASNDFITVIFDIDDSAFKTLENKFICKKVDVTCEESVVKAVKEVISEFNKIDLLVNNAGIIFSAPLLNIMKPAEMRHSLSEFKRNIDINMISVFLVTSIVAEQMVIKRTKGVIVNISSISASGNAGQSAYSAAKAGVEAMTKVWSKELGAFGIRTNAVSPGFIDTPSTSSAINDKIIDHVIKNTPLKRLGRVTNVAQAVLHLVNNDFLNGTVLEVNGGLVI